jgi:hypothetical protein
MALEGLYVPIDAPWFAEFKRELCDDLWRIIAFIRSVNPSSFKPANTCSAPIAAGAARAGCQLLTQIGLD